MSDFEQCSNQPKIDLILILVKCELAQIGGSSEKKIGTKNVSR